MVLLSVDFSNLHTILESLYNEMMPLCGDMLDVAKGLAGLGALFYVAVRVWQSLARAEPIDVYPLLRPFAIGICIMLFPTLVLGTMNTVLSPIVQGTHKMLEGQTMDMQQYREQKDRLEREAMLRKRPIWSAMRSLTVSWTSSDGRPMPWQPAWACIWKWACTIWKRISGTPSAVCWNCFLPRHPCL